MVHVHGTTDPSMVLVGVEAIKHQINRAIKHIMVTSGNGSMVDWKSRQDDDL